MTHTKLWLLFKDWVFSHTFSTEYIFSGLFWSDPLPLDPGSSNYSHADSAKLGNCTQQLQSIEIFRILLPESWRRQKWDTTSHSSYFDLYWLPVSAGVYMKVLWMICKDFNGLVLSKISNWLFFHLSSSSDYTSY